jgi:hypothetical protein
MTSYGGAPSGTLLVLFIWSKDLMRLRVLVVFDRHISSACGRPCAVQDEECASEHGTKSSPLILEGCSFDVDLPADCDDEYWENDDPKLVFKQPVDKPSKIAFFISLIKLQQILAFSLRTIVSGLHDGVRLERSSDH